MIIKNLNLFGGLTRAGALLVANTITRPNPLPPRFNFVNWYFKFEDGEGERVSGAGIADREFYCVVNQVLNRDQDFPARLLYSKIKEKGRSQFRSLHNAPGRRSLRWLVRRAGSKTAFFQSNFSKFDYLLIENSV